MPARDRRDRPWTVAGGVRHPGGTMTSVLDAADGVTLGLPGDMPTSFAQQRLWFLEQLGTMGAAYHLAKWLHLKGDMDREAVGRVLDRILYRHEALRTTFHEVDGEPVQRVIPADECRFPLRDHDLTGHPHAREELDRLMSEEVAAPFDLERGPLIRGLMVRLAPDEHVAVITVHHIVADGWSMGVWLSEVTVLYGAFVRGEPDPLPPLKMQYGDYATWQRGWLVGEVLEQQMAYWRGVLAGAPEMLELPTDHTRPARQSHTGAYVRLVLDDTLTAGLKALSQRHGTTMFMTVLAGWATVLGRLSGQTDVVIGAPTANRRRKDVRWLIGFFINTLAMRVDLSGSPTVAELLKRVKARAMEAQQHQDIPFEQVVEAVQPVRSLAHSALFQVTLNWQNAFRGSLEMPGLTFGNMASASPVTAKFDLSLELQEVDGQIQGGAEYATALFERSTVERYLGYLRHVLEGMVADDQQRADCIPMMPDDERQQVLAEWNATDAPYPAESCLHHLFEAQVERTPEAVAVVQEGAELSYEDLNARANRLAHHLRALGVGPDARVAICVETSPEMLVGVLAMLKAGGAYVPLDPSYPVERLRYMLRDSAPAALLTHGSLGRLFEGVAIPLVSLDDADVWADQPESNPQVPGLTPDHLAYVIYTSGSTGRPKGVLNQHRCVVNRVAWMQGEWGHEAASAVLQNASLSFDVSAYELILPLSVGGRVVMPRHEGNKDPRYLVELIRRERVRLASFVPSMLQLFLEEPEVVHCTDLLRVPCGGEAMPPGLVERFRERLPGATLHNRYGPSEAATSISGRVCDAEQTKANVPIGRPVSNARIYILDTRGEPVPAGVAGELYIGGVPVGRGYLNRPGMTAERFVPDPFGTEVGARLYRTGDLARWLGDGRVEFLGRNDFQVKVRGFRIEPGEVEARLSEHVGVRGVAVQVQEDASGERRLVAYYAGDDSIPAESLRAHVLESLPEYMVPSAFVCLDALPLNANGKVDRLALPRVEVAEQVKRAYEPPVGEREEALAEIWKAVLKVERVGRHDHFFELGGHSLRAVQVVSRTRQLLGVEVALGDLFLRPVLADFAAGLERSARAELPPIEPVSRNEPLPLSFAQQRLWFLDQLGAVGTSYHIPVQLRLDGELDREVLGRALDRIVARHEALRTTFAQVDGEPVQRIAPAEGSRFLLAEHDLSAHLEPDAELARLREEETSTTFDLEQGPLIRGSLIRIAQNEHVLLVTMHHIVSDGWSMGVLIEELSTLYTAFRGGEDDPLPEPAVQYADYAAWQRKWVDGELLRRQAGYWKQTLAGAPELLELPTDHTRPARQDHAGAYAALELDEELTRALDALARRHGATLFMTLLAGWAATLSRLSGQQDVVIGTPTANRGRREIEKLVGFFVNTLALRVDVSGEPTIAELLGRVKERTLAAQDHQDIPFEQVVEGVQPVRSLAHTPLFQVMFAWQNTPRGELELPGLTLRSVDSASRVTAKFDLSLSLAEQDGRIVGGVEYATSLFERATVERFLGYFRRVLEGMAADEYQALDQLPMLPEAERHQVLAEWNATGAPYPAASCLHHLFEAQVERTPEAVAVVQEGAEGSYKDLNARANRLAHHLRSLGVGPDARVAICVETSPEMLVGVLAVLKAGGAYVPLDPSYPVERLRYMLRDSAPAALLTHGSLGRLFEGVNIPLVQLDDASAWADQPNTNPRVPGLTPDHLAYVIYTSGSTGRPKGVLNQHRCVVNRVAWMQGEWGHEAASAVLQNASLSFDVSAYELILPLSVGGRVVMPRHEGNKDPRYLVELIRREKVRLASFVPSMLQLFLEEPEVVHCTDLLRVPCGGEAMPPGLVERFRERLPGATLHNRYGPSEAATSISGRVCDAEQTKANVPIGRPVSNARIYILDTRGEPVPAGVAGELYIGGVPVGRGYLNRPGMTAERFVPDPFGTEAGARLYRTGDLARWLGDGRVEFLGRNDFQVKVRGFRIEPGEVEARLSEHAGVRGVAVQVQEDASGERRLVAYYAGDDSIPAESLRAHLLESLPEYMVPSAFVRLEALPLNANGKVDRLALPRVEEAEHVDRAFEPPVGEREEALAEIWEAVLKVERVGRHDHFFEMGGHSLRAVQVVSRTRQTLGVEVALGDLFLRPVLADFAAGLERSALAELPLIERVSRNEPLPLSFAQQRLWFLEQMGAVGTAYHIPVQLRLDGELDREVLGRALDRIVARHEALRTTFAQADGEPVQRIAPAEGSRFYLVEHDLSAHAKPDAELARLREEETRTTFDLEQGPLIRGRLIRIAQNEHVLLVTMHHIVSDGWSMGVLIEELSTLYTAFRGGEDDPLPEPAVQYADYAAWQRKWVDGELLRRQAGYWKQTLAGAPELLELPTDHTRPARQDHAGAYAALELDEELTRALDALARRHGATLFMTLLAGWAATLSRLSGQQDVVIGTPTANRGRREIEKLVGFFVNTLALRVDLGGEPTVAELLSRVKKRALEAQDHQDIPFEQVVEGVQPVRSLAHTPLFQVMFAWQNTPRGELELPGVTLGSVDSASRVTAKFDLSMSLAEQDGRIVGGVEYATSLFERPTVERYLAYFRRVLEEMAADERQRVSQLSLLPAEERRLVLEEWNATEAAYPADTCVHELFEAQAARTPDAVAVVHDGESLSYAELNARANRLAHHLRTLGVEPSARVAMLLPRSIELVAAELAVLKTGAAYVPIDPSFPAGRIAFMVADSAARVVLARSGDDLPALASVERVDADALPEGPAHDPRIALDSEAAAYVMYTSGSTGAPKGVVVPHRAIARLVINNGYAEFSPGDRVAFAANPAFDASTMEVWAPLLNGGRIVVIGQDVLLDPRRFGDALNRHGVDVLWMTVGLFNQYAEELRDTLPRLRYLIVGGDALEPRAIARVLANNPPKHLLNGYGPTETTTFAITHEITDVADGARSIPLGRPVGNARIYILDDAGQPVPVGVAGEIYIGGKGVALGYLNRPELTAERFVADPFSGAPRARMYRTGDLGRWLPDGTIEFLGRNDQQVKVRGYRIELGEIEARLAEHAGVREVAVLAREDAPGDRRLVAYYVGEDVEAEALRVHLAERVPQYMVPAAYVRLEAMPLTANGKADRRALPAPEGDAYATRGYEAPADEVEGILAGIWAEVLRVERVGRWDHFFELGGHSLLAVQVASRIRQALGVEVALGDLFVHPVLAELARGLQTAARATLPPIEPASAEERRALSFAQQRLWFLEQLGSAGSAYHLPAALRLRGELDRDALGRALDRIVERHEALRTVFPTVDGNPEQRIAPAEQSRFHLQLHDLTGHPEADAELARIMAEEAGAAFDLVQGPLVRGRLVRMAEDEHVLLVTMHHIVSDGWSVGVLTRELSALYGAFQSGAADPLPALETQYADYAAWQRRWVEGGVLEEQAEYWKETLAGAPELLDLPTDRARPARQDHAGAALSLELDEETTSALKALGRRHGATLYMTLVAGWATVLSRLSGQEDVVIGTPTANRGRAEIEGLIGFFVNTLALRVNLAGEPTVAELLGRVKARALEAQQRQDIPFEQVVERVQPARSLAHSPLFQVLFAWQNTPAETLELPGLTLSAVESAQHVTAKFDLSLWLAEADGRVVGSVTYATALFERATVERYLGYLRRVLVAMAADDGQFIGRLPMIAKAERQEVLQARNATEAAYPSESCLHELFEAQAERTPGAVAVEFGDAHLTYAELNARANRLAHHLRTLGVGADARVAVCLERGPEMLAALLGVLKAGGAYVPLDPSYPVERLRYMLADSAPVALLTDTERLFDGVDIPLVNLDAAWADQPETNPERAELTPEHLAYVIYTSGSTGTPKGVMVAHRGVVNLLSTMRGTVGMEPSDVLLSVTTIAFDIAALELFLPLACGARTVILEPARAADPALLEQAIVRHGATVMQATPATWRILVDAGWQGRDGLKALSGGEALPSALATAVRERVGALWNVYGPTETTIWSTAEQIGGTMLGARAPIGRPIANTRIYILGRDLQPLPMGVAGEMYIGGAGVARGYHGRPALTAERFVPDPYGVEAGARMYRTGDLARWLPDGTIEFLGRNDHQVKVRGHRIELGEIEAGIAAHPEVGQAVVVTREYAPGDVRLVAYYTGAAVQVEAMRAHLAERLPEYMIPAVFVRLEALPLTPNGKIDRNALPAPEGEVYAGRAYEAPDGATEEALAEIWAEVLGVERVGRHDHFFELGGHSLLAVQVISRVRRALGADAALGDLFVRPVLAEFARGLETAPRDTLPAIERADRSGPLALSFAQQRVWFLEQLGVVGAAYHIPVRLRVQGALDRAALGRALDRIVARHEALRTTFAQVGGEPVQRVAEESGFRLIDHDLTHHPDAQSELARLTAEEAGARFDLEDGPLIRGRLIRIAPDEHVLLVTMHHIVSDGWSMGVLTRELSALYGAFQRGEADPLPALEIQYADYAAWQRRFVEGERLRQQAEYWKAALAGAPAVLELPSDRARPAQQDFAGAVAAVELDEELTAGLKALSQRHGTTLFMTLMAAWAATLSRLSGQDDVVIGTPTANRGRAEIEGLIGFFVNTLALRVDLSDQPTVAELLGRVRERALDAQRHQDIPFEQVVEAVQPARTLAHTPLFQVLFAWQNTPQGGAELPGLTLSPADATSRVTAKFDLSLALSEQDGRIVGGVEYATALFDRATVERYLGYLRRVLEEMVADDTQPVDRLPMLPGAERRQVVEEWNDTAVEYPRDLCIHHLFEQQVERTPDAVAVVFGDQALTYAELNARANRLAHHLRALGVGPDVRVAIGLERGLEMMVGLFAVLKAGGAYVPLDPAYPADRLRYMLADSAPAVLLTQSSLAALFPGVEVPVLELDAPVWADAPAGNPGPAGLTAEHLAYVIYTSGSTGRPKGVMNEHRGVVNRLLWMQDAYGLRAEEAVLQKTPVSFDVSVWELFWAPLAGARVVMLEPEAHREPRRLAEAIEREGVGTVHFVPSMLQLFLEHAPLERCGSLKRVICSGEALPASVVRRFAERLPGVELYNLYGPTEAAVDVTWWRCEGAREGGSVPIGRPVSNTRIYVLDAGGEPVPVGVAGELYIGGVQVARGYLNRDELTAERFVENPFHGGRMYRTGDVARWRADGAIEYLGRNDEQVKLRGFRIELGEIEARLAMHPAVREATVLMREDTPGDRRLVAYLVGEPVEAEALRTHLLATLPEYMVPAAYVRLDALPLTPNGKLDRRALPAPEGGAFAARAYEAPEGEIEEALAEVWAELLGVERVGRHDNFFELGGHSLLVVRLIDRMDEVGLHADVRALFTAPTLAGFAAVTHEIQEIRL